MRICALGRSDGWLNHLPADASEKELVRETYLRLVNRPPTGAESSRCEAYFAEMVAESPRRLPAAKCSATSSGAINSAEFITNH